MEAPSFRIRGRRVDAGSAAPLNPVFLRPIPYSLPLPRRPGERASAEKVDVEMLDGLAAVLAGVDHQAVSLGEAFVARHLSGGPEQVAEQKAVALIGIVQGGDVFARHHQQMHGRLRMKVGKGVA